MPLLRPLPANANAIAWTSLSCRRFCEVMACAKAVHAGSGSPHIKRVEATHGAPCAIFRRNEVTRAFLLDLKLLAVKTRDASRLVR